MARRIAIVMALCFMSVAGFAQGFTLGNAYLGYSVNNATTGWSNPGYLPYGWELSVEGKVAPILGFVLDGSGQYGEFDMPKFRVFGGTGTVNAPTRVVSFMVGPRVSITRGRFRPFAQALAGSAHLHESTREYDYGETCAADAIGGGIDYRLTKQLSWRVQGDWLQTRFHYSTQSSERMSTGIVLNF